MSAATYWGKQIAVEPINGVPFRMYTDRPRRIEHLLPFADNWGDRPCIIHGERVVSFAMLRRASAAKARELVGLGVGRGDRVVIIGWNGPDWVMNFWACVQIGAVPALGNAWWGEAELQDALTLIRPAITLADRHASARMPAGWRRGIWEVDETAAGAYPADAPVPDALQGDENEPAAIIFTSGTQGQAKAVVLAHRSLIASMMMLLHVTRRLPYWIDETLGDVCLHTGPLFHIGGLHALVRGVVVGNTLVMLRGRFEPGEVLELIEHHKVVRWNAVPTMAMRLLDHLDLKRPDVSSLQAMTLGGAPVHAELLRRVRTDLPSVQARVATGYGLSENAGQATAASGADTAARPGSSGRPLPCAEVKAVLRPGWPDGEILVRSPTQMLGYFGSEESPIDAEGWLHTGDLGRIDADGHVWITGRSKDIIIRGGENIAPAAVERALMSIPGVAEAVVFGVANPDLGEEVMAVLVVEGAPTEDDIRARLRGHLASFAVPTLWKLQTEPLPVNQTGKVDKSAVIAAVRADHAQAGRSAAQ